MEEPDRRRVATFRDEAPVDRPQPADDIAIRRTLRRFNRRDVATAELDPG
jgi:hypothetical protein